MSEEKATRQLTPVPFTRVNFNDVFWAPRQTVNRDVTLKAEYQQLKETGRIDALKLDWKPGMEPVPHFYWESDTAKWIEAAAYSLSTHPDPELDELLDEVIALFAGAQQPDGYLNVYFTIVEPEKRWANLLVNHELYCAGHLMEAAVAHYQATGKRTLLDVIMRFADNIDSVFGNDEGKRFGACGHEEIELALVRLYHATGESRYLKLSEFFINQRGQKPSIFAREDRSDGPPQPFNADTFSYVQDHLPVREQSEVTGHAVRATYLYSGMADVANETGDSALIAACHRIWNDVTLRKMHVTGGIGPSAQNEGFTVPYDLPNESAYCETCAAIGLVFWAHRLLQFEGDSRFADVMELSLYNGTISGISLDGTKFFYVNPLESSGGHHRQGWFGCACCPPNIARLLASIGQYAYSEGTGNAWVHLYAQGEATLQIDGQDVVITQQTQYPWDGAVKLQVKPQQAATFTLNLRLPGWCQNATLTIDGEAVDIAANLDKGYIKVNRQWTGDEDILYTLSMPVERVQAHPAVKADAGMIALQRGPVVYCLEQADNAFRLHQAILPTDAKFDISFAPDLLSGICVLHTQGQVEQEEDWEGVLYRTEPKQCKQVMLTAIPYSVWDNREPGEMRVWLRQC